MKILELASKALAEDGVQEDVTTAALEKALVHLGKARVPLKLACFVIVAKAEGVFSGRAWVEALSQLGPFEVLTLKGEGETFTKGECVLKGQGAPSRILSLERTLLNELQHLCGIATKTRQYIERVEKAFQEKSIVGQKPGVYHTRKTLALHRELEVEAVEAGGGERHRQTLSQRILLKENHKILAAKEGMDFFHLVKVICASHPDALIEVENQTELMLALRASAKHLLLDNFSVEQVVEGLPQVPPETSVEISGGLSLEHIGNYVLPGVSRLSVGALTHSALAVDLSLDWAWA